MKNNTGKYLCKECFKKGFESLFGYEPKYLDSYELHRHICEDCGKNFYSTILLSEDNTYVKRSKLPPGLSRSEELNLMYPGAKIGYNYPYGLSEYNKISDTEWACRDWKSKYLT